MSPTVTSEDKFWRDVPNEFDLPKGLELRELAGTDINPFQFDPPGPIGEQFIYGQAPIDYLMGPAGSGKTVCAIMRALVMALRMPVCEDGIIRARMPVMRDNFRTLYRTTLPSLFRFFPKDFPGATFEGGQDRPFCFTLRFITPKGKRLQLAIDGFGIGDHSVEELLKGYEASAAWLEEADLMARNVKTFMFGRVAQGRYPGRALLKDEKAKLPRSIWGTLNPPLITHYIVEDFVEKPMGGHVLRRQPGGLTDQAENRRYVSREDYQAMADVLKPDEKRRQVDGEFGIQGDGALVYPDFNYLLHVAAGDLPPLEHLPLLLGFDAKGTPAMAITQYTPKGQLRVLDELIGEPNMGAGRFAEHAVDLLQSQYRGCPVAQGWADPSGFWGADKQAGELSFMEIIGKALGVHILPTPTNDPQTRQEAVDWFLRRPSGGEPVPYFLMSKRCKMLLNGFQGGFLIALNPHETSSRIAFVKNKASHGHEALQYVAYGCRGHAGLINDAARAGRPGNVTPIRAGARPARDFNVFDV